MPPVDLRGARPRARTARRTSSTRATKTGLPDRPQGRRRRRRRHRAARRSASAAGATDAEAHRDGRTRPPDPRLDRTSSGAGGRRTTRARARSPGPGQRLGRAGATTSGDRHVRRGTPTRASTTLRRRPVGQQILAYSPAADGSGFPAARPAAWPTARAVATSTTCTSTATSSSSRTASRAVRRRQQRGLGGDAAGRRAAARARRSTRSIDARHRPAARASSMRTTRPTGGSSRYRQGEGTFVEQYRLAGGTRLGRPARHVRRRRARATEPGDARLDRTRRGLHRGRSWRRVPDVPGRRQRRRRPPRQRPRPPVGRAPGARDPAPGRQPDPADAGHHARPDRRLLRRLRLGARRPGERRRGGADDVLHALRRRAGRPRRAASGRGELLSAARARRPDRACSCTAAGCTCSATCCSCGSSATTSRTASAGSAFLAFYLAGRRRRGLTQVAIDPTSTMPLIGASGAIAAALGAYLVLFPRARILSLVFLGFFYQLIEVPALIVLGLLVRPPAHRRRRLARRRDAPSGGVAFFAHIGGLRRGRSSSRSLRPGRRAARAGRHGCRPVRPWDNPAMAMG